ncbi:UPF0488 protein C8orf33 homolog [Mastacembelus armatus]|uniref:Zgc:112185 n=1 Tax=Mastacembelus armatus TaxID=205130 RepID=A0A3Q3S010_9TELE|nr:UPF0488 protein C8orf33 homolog [Mastacembelus armatus]
MTEQRLLFIDIESKPNSCTSTKDRAEQPVWTRSDNTFRFNFFPDDSRALQEKTSEADGNEPVTSWTSLTGQSSAFAFNFQIPPVTLAEDMETTEAAETSSTGSRQCVTDEKISPLQDIMSPSEPSEHSEAKKKKKKKKSGNKKSSDSTETQQKPSEGKVTELSAEEQLNRELDWCIEQLELGLRSQKGTPKQKEEASRALKTLRSSKAPLAKKRQLMRAMTGDYRKKMEEEKNRQFKLIQSETASAEVKVVSDSPKKSVFHRRAEVKTQSPAMEENLQQTATQLTDLKQTQEETAAFVFTPSKEVFHFNFL